MTLECVDDVARTSSSPWNFQNASGLTLTVPIAYSYDQGTSNGGDRAGEVVAILTDQWALGRPSVQRPLKRGGRPADTTPPLWPVPDCRPCDSYVIRAIASFIDQHHVSVRLYYSLGRPDWTGSGAPSAPYAACHQAGAPWPQVNPRPSWPAG
jgi:hypothetical protein